MALTPMELTHHGLDIELPDEWWVEAEMTGFVPRTAAYRVDRNLFKNVREVPIEEVGPGHRDPRVGIFKDSEEGVRPASESCEFCAASG